MSQPFQCMECGKCFSTKSWLQVHTQLHQPERNHQCEMCGKRFKVAVYLRKHIIKVHQEPQYQCRWCPETFKDGWYRGKHEESHTSTEQHGCGHCDKVFPTTFKLTQHLKVHEEKMHQCPHCEKSFLFPNKLKRHMAIHDEDRNQYNCEACKRIFFSKKARDTHVENMGIIECEKCGLKMHGGEESMQKHLAKSHKPEEYIYKCKFCDESTIYPKQLDLHMAYLHPGEFMLQENPNYDRSEFPSLLELEHS